MLPLKRAKKRYFTCMKPHITLISLITTGILLFSCSRSSDGQQPSSETVTVTYKATDADFPNPERGFYRHIETLASNYTPLETDELKQWRGLSDAEGGANYQIYTTLVMRQFVMDQFTTQPLSAAFLDLVKQDFDRAREAGIKLIPRFSYTITSKAGNCPEGFICPPYGDASKEIVLQHIEQLKPILVAASDVIAVMQFGFIGTWGENYYTDYFGDASQNAQGKLLDQNWKDRTDVMRALLQALPANRMMQVRYPQLKQRYVYGVNSQISVPALLESEAFTETDKARIGFHNDCFLASADDYGTYEDYGNSGSPRSSALSALKQYARDDSRFVAVGGETCDDAFSPQNDCEPAGIAETEMRELHYSYLNSSYNNQVNNDWQTNGCMQKIKARLGYRFVLKEFIHPKEASAGKSTEITIRLVNEGFASPFNKRPVQLVLRNKTNNSLVYINLDSDVRKWFSGDIEVKTNINLPSDLAAGEYELLLALRDDATSIANRPEYAIRLANDGLWEESTGLNKLNTSIVIR